MARKQKINTAEAEELLNGFGFTVEYLTYYQFRIRGEESKAIYDWYHTTGVMVKVIDGLNLRIGREYDVEKVAEFIKNDIYKKTYVR